jgi:peptidoglycan glycosyltransferase
MRRRITLVGALFLLIFAVLFLQLNDLQIAKANSLANAPGNYSAIIKAFSTPRGEILTANGQVMASSVHSTSQYKYQRVYPHGSLYADVTGYYSLIYGTSGLEYEYNKYLEGQVAAPSSLSRLFTKSYTTDSVVTTLQSSLQQTAYKALGSLKGAVVALNPKTGAVLAMASNPTYNPAPLASASGTTEEDAWKSDIANSQQPLLNRAISRAYPPGSTFKIVTTSAIFDHDPKLAHVNFPPVATIALPQTTHHLHNYAYEVCGGELPVLLAVSCDTGFAQIGLRLGASNLHNEAENFGFNQVPPIDLPGAAASTFPSTSFFSQNLPQLAFSAIGQGNDQATALQMALVGAGIANNGSIMVPHLLGRVISSQDATVTSFQPKVWKVATSPSTAAKVTRLMVGVVKSGTAAGIALPGIEIAAKTGTAQTTLTSHSNIVGQSDNWMVAFAPAQNPKIAVAVVVPKQAGLSANPTGAQYAGPVVKAMLAAALGVKS